MSCFFPLFKILRSKILILSCFKQLIQKSWYSWLDTGQQKFSIQRKIYWVKWELQIYFWHKKYKFVEWVKKIQGWIVIILSRFLIFILFNLVSWFMFAIKERIWKYFDSFSKIDHDIYNSWFLTLNVKSETIFPDSCLIQRLRI